MLVKALALITLIAATSVVTAQDICSDAGFRASVRDLQPIKLEDFRPPVKSKLLIVGEMHYHTDPAFLQMVLSQLAVHQSSKPCLFVEFSAAVDPHEMLAIVQKALSELPPGPSEERTDFSEMLGYYGPLLSKADQLGLKAFSVDHPDNFGQGMGLNERDAAISSRLQDLLGNGTCSTGILFVGKAHVTADETGRVTLMQLLDESHVPLTTFVLQQQSDPGPWLVKSWDGLCNSPPLHVAQDPIVFSNDQISAATQMWPRMTKGTWTGGRWRDFDFTILAP